MLSAVFAFLRAVLPPDATDDAEHVRRAVAGDERSQRVLIERLLPVMRARVASFLVRRGTVGAADRDDLVQEVWAYLWADRGRVLLAYDPERGSLARYVAFLTEREVLVRLREQRAQKRGGDLVAVELDDATPLRAPGDPESAAVDRDLLRVLDAHLQATLPERGRLVLQLLYVDHLAPPEVAQMIGVQLQVVYNWQHKIRQLARELVTERTRPAV